MADGKHNNSLKGVWEHVSDENLDDFLKEIGVGMAKRMMAKGMKPRLTIMENDGKWTIRSESSLKKANIEFTPGVEFEETAADGRDVKTVVHFIDNNRWEHRTRDSEGHEWLATRFVNGQGMQQLDIKCGAVTARRLFKRVE